MLLIHRWIQLTTYALYLFLLEFVINFLYAFQILSIQFLQKTFFNNLLFLLYAYVGVIIFMCSTTLNILQIKISSLFLLAHSEQKALLALQGPEVEGCVSHAGLLIGHVFAAILPSCQASALVRTNCYQIICISLYCKTPVK